MTTTYYDPLIGAGIAALMQPNTRAVFTEAPGSLTFEMQDIPAIAAVAHQHDALVLMDNTWAGPLYFKALDKGVDLSIQSGTKYIGGHSDLMLGTVSANKATAQRLKDTVYTMGLCVGPDDMNLDSARLAHAGGAAAAATINPALKIAQWLAERRRSRRCCIRRCRRAGPRHLEARFHRRLRIVQRSCSSRCPRRRRWLSSTRCRFTASARPGAASRALPSLVRRGALSHRDEMGAGRPDASASTSDLRTLAI